MKSLLTEMHDTRQVGSCRLGTASKEGGVENITEKSLEDFTNYVRCPHCWGKVYQANKLLQDAPGEGATTEEPLTDTPKQEQPDAVNKEADDVTSQFWAGLPKDENN